MKETTLAYAAGLVDGEGSIMLSHERAWSRFRLPTVSVASTTPELLHELLHNFGGAISNKRTFKKGHTPSQVWRVTHRHALKFLVDILPYLHVPEKVRRARLLVYKYALVTPRNGKYTSAMRKNKQSFERAFFSHSTKTRV